MSRSFWLQIILYVFFMIFGAFGLRYALAKRGELSRGWYRILMAAGVILFVAGFLLLLLVGRTYPQSYGGWSFFVPDDYKAVAFALLWA